MSRDRGGHGRCRIDWIHLRDVPGRLDRDSWLGRDVHGVRAGGASRPGASRLGFCKSKPFYTGRLSRRNVHMPGRCTVFQPLRPSAVVAWLAHAAWTAGAPGRCTVFQPLRPSIRRRSCGRIRRRSTSVLCKGRHCRFPRQERHHLRSFDRARSSLCWCYRRLLLPVASSTARPWLVLETRRVGRARNFRCSLWHYHVSS